MYCTISKKNYYVGRIFLTNNFSASNLCDQCEMLTILYLKTKTFGIVISTHLKQINQNLIIVCKRPIAYITR